MAEYTAVLTAARFAVEAGAESLHVRTDSRLVVNQINGEFRVTKPHLAALLNKVREAAKPLDFQIEWISRDENTAADGLTWSVRQIGSTHTKELAPVPEAVAEVSWPDPASLPRSPRKRKVAAWTSLHLASGRHICSKL